jgi:hypothetical protein
MIKPVVIDISCSYPTAYFVTIPDVSGHGDSKWKVGVRRQYPLFAEYAKGMAADGTSGLSDTVLTVRAFLPIDDEGNRSSLHTYKGPAAVIDTHVVCVRPNITDLSLSMGTDDLSEDPVVSGKISIPLSLLETASSSGLSPSEWNNFSCELPRALSAKNGMRYDSSDWSLTICRFD